MLVEFFERAVVTGSGPVRADRSTRAYGVARSPGLHWSDVDLVARQIVVRHNRVSVDGRVQETTTKTRSGRRTVPLSDAAVAALLTWQLHQAEERESGPGGVADAGARVHDGGRPAARSGLRDAAVPEDPHAG